MIIGLNSYAAMVDKEMAQKVAENYYFMAISSYDKSMQYEPENISLVCIKDASEHDYSAYYIFNSQTTDGFIIVSASDKVKPILAYSFESKFNSSNIAPSQQYLLDYYQNMIIGVEDGRVIPDKDATTQWKLLSDITKASTLKNFTTVPGLLGNISWNQSMPYNAMCPQADGAYQGYGGRCPVGCSAIAMLQIMKYYNWPPSGTGSYTHTSNENGGFGDITVNFGQFEYNWAAIPDHANQPNDELSKICFHGGVAAKMYWSPQGSGAWPDDVAFGLINYFGYQDNISLEEKEYYPENEWKDMLRSQIDNKKPIFYVGYTDEAGHAWNCDGYQGDDHFHMNWGWGGSGNGFYTLDALGTSATPGSSEGNYNQYQHALFDIYPNGSYPNYCQNNFVVTSNQGSFDDGSSVLDYQNNQSCTYVIEPECKNIVELEFTKFELASGDVLQLWDGSVDDNKLLGTFDNDNQPENTVYRATSGKLTITFDTDDSQAGDGWKINYETKICLTKLPITESSGSFEDGSGDCNYSKSLFCSWLLTPEDANRIFLNFEYFDLTGSTDFVDIYFKKIASTNLSYKFDRDNLPEETLVIFSDTVIVRFFTGSFSTSGDGWKINYSSIFTESNRENENEKITIFPNPGGNNSVLFFESNIKTSAEISVVNTLGEIVAKKDLELMQGINQIPLSNLTRNLDNAMYLILLKENNNNYNIRFVKMP